MKKGFVFLFLIGILLTTYYGLKNHFGVIEKLAPQTRVESSLEKVCPILEDQKIITIVLAENHVKGITRTLDSLFIQTYPHADIIVIDNGSTDGTYERAENHSKNRERSVELIRCEQRKSPLEILYEVIGRLDPHDIVAIVYGKDWLAHENVLDHLNCVYANPEVWMTHSRSISHPEYRKVLGQKLSSEGDFRQTYREKISPLITFYAGLFQKIKLQDFLYQGQFIDEGYELATFLPLLEMGIYHLLFMDEICYVQNTEDSKVDHALHLQKVAAVDSYLRSLFSYSPLSQLTFTLSSPSFHRYKTDLLLFSEDHPLHLYACLESIFANAHDINDIYVIYKGSDQEFERAYLNLQNEFHSVQFLNVCDYPGNDCGTLFSKVISNHRHTSPYLIISEDQLILEKPVRFHECINAMERVHADHFFLNPIEKDTVSHPISLSPAIYAFQLRESRAKHPLTFALCRKVLFENTKEIEDLSSFYTLWREKLSPESVVLFLEEEKILPLTLSQKPTPSQKREWGRKFIEGYKIDLTSLSSELDAFKSGDIPLIKRDRRRIIAKTPECH